MECSIELRGLYLLSGLTVCTSPILIERTKVIEWTVLAIRIVLIEHSVLIEQYVSTKQVVLVISTVLAE